MEISECKEILKDAGVSVYANEQRTWKPFLRQFMISAGFWILYLIQGLNLGAPTVLIAQLRKEENSTITDEMVSWLSSVPVISAEPFILILPLLFYKIGRKYTFITVTCFSTIGFIIFYASTNVYHLLISQMCLGTIVAGANTFLPVMIAEYTSPKYRGIFLTTKSACTFWGIWIANAIGTFFPWKNIAFVAFACFFYTITVIAWPESPYWLAMKGRYPECAKSHRWLKGVDEDSEKELAKLIKLQKKNKNVMRSSETNEYFCISSLSSTWSTVTSRPFYKPTLICMVLFAQYEFSGKFIISMYAIDVFKSLTNDVSVAYKGMLILDGFTVASMYGGCILSRYYKRKTLMIFFSGTAIIFLFMISFYLYLVSWLVLRENHVVLIFLLTTYSVATGCGPMVLSTSIYGEIIPSQFQSSVMIISALYNLTMMSILLKLTPFMIKTLSTHGYFLFFAVSSSIILVLLHKYLPETKDKSIFDIEEEISGRQTFKHQRDTLLCSKELINIKK